MLYNAVYAVYCYSSECTSAVGCKECFRSNRLMKLVYCVTKTIYMCMIKIVQSTAYDFKVCC